MADFTHTPPPMTNSIKALTKQTDSNLQIKLNQKGLYPSDSMKYLVIKIDRNLPWDHETKKM